MPLCWGVEGHPLEDIELAVSDKACEDWFLPVKGHQRGLVHSFWGYLWVHVELQRWAGSDHGKRLVLTHVEGGRGIAVEQPLLEPGKVFLSGRARQGCERTWRQFSLWARAWLIARHHHA